MVVVEAMQKAILQVVVEGMSRFLAQVDLILALEFQSHLFVLCSYTTSGGFSS